MSINGPGNLSDLLNGTINGTQGGIPNAVNGFGPDPTIYGLSQNQGALEIPIDPAGLINDPGTRPAGGSAGSVNAGGDNPANTPGHATLSQLLQDFYRLPRDQQILLEQRLWQGGFYTDSAGNPMRTAPQFGTDSADTNKALTNAALEAAGTGKTFNQIVADAAAQGLGAQGHTMFKPGVVAHGYRNVIDLRNPNDVNYAVDKMSQQLLGRLATEQEKNSVLQVIQSQDFADGMAKYTAQEQMSYQDFLARVAQRDEQFAAMTGYQINPGGSTGAAAMTAAGGTQGQVMAYLQGKGLTAAQAAGVVGNLQQESNLNPNSPGGGIAQWQGSRWNNLVAFASQQGKSPNDLGVQLDFLWHELTSTESGSLTALQQANTPAEAAQSFSNSFERPGTPMMQNRINYANAAASGAPAGGMASGLTNPQGLLGANGTASLAGAPISVGGMTSGPSQPGNSFISAAESQIGIPYQWGGEAPGSGFDCSGLVQWAMKQQGIDPGRTTWQQIANPRGAPVPDLAQAQPGDLIFFDPTGGTNPEHVGIYLGGGQMLDADHPGDSVGIRKSVQGYGNIVGIRRFPIGSGQSGSNLVQGNDTYIPGSNTLMTQPGSPEAQAYAQITQGPDRIDYGAHNILNGIGIINQMINANRG